MRRAAPPSKSSREREPQAALVCVGSELLRGKLNTHAALFGRRLASVGIAMKEEATFGDERAILAAAIRGALERHEIVIVTGGLGPTFDDISREAAADACGKSLVISKSLAAGIRAKFKFAGYAMPETNMRQAYLIEGAQAILNSNGTAPGQWLKLGPRKVVVLLPGPPRELTPMLEGFLLGALRKMFSTRPRAEAHLHFVGVPESIVDQKVRPLIEAAQRRAREPIDFTILAHLGLVDFDIFVSGKTEAVARKVLEPLARSVARLFKDAFYGRDDDYPLEKVIHERFAKKRLSLAVAESCTGGLLGARLTEVPGSSDFFRGGVVAYSNAVKARTLRVPSDILKGSGAVSEACAIAMAQGVRESLGSDWGLSITGIAGPDGGTTAKPIGLVYIALASVKGATCTKYQFRGAREVIRQRAVLAALDALRRLG